MSTLQPSDSAVGSTIYAGGPAGDLRAGLQQLDPLLALPDHPAAAAPGLPFAKYVLGSKLGKGRFGLVLLGVDPSLGRLVVVKVPQPQVLADRELVERFTREGHAAARLDHDGIVKVFEAGNAGGLPYLAAGYVNGPTLAAWREARPGPVPPAAAARFMRAIADAVHHAHERGVLHCDLTPANILLAPKAPDPSGLDDFAPQVTDFGLARLLDDDPALTRTYRVAGTPLYMSPEQAAGDRRNLTTQADVYALGAILYDLLTGRPPFPGTVADEVMEQVKTGTVMPPRRRVPGLPRDISAVAMKCLERRPGDRYDSADALAADLGRYLADRPVRARPVPTAVRAARWAVARPATSGLLLLAVIGLSAAAILAVDAWRRGVRADADARVVEAERQSVRVMQMAAEFRDALGRARTRRERREPGWAAANREELKRVSSPFPDDRSSDEMRTEAAAVASAIDLGEPREAAPAFRGCAAAFSPDGQTLAVIAQSCGVLNNGVILLVDANTGTDRRRLHFPGDKSWIARAVTRLDGGWSVTFSPDGKRLVAGTRSGWLCVWELDNPSTEPAAFWRHAPPGDIATAPNERVSRLAFDPKGRLWSGDDRTVACWDGAKNWAEVVRKDGHLVRPPGPTLDPARAVTTDFAALAGELLVRRRDSDHLGLFEAATDQPVGRLTLPDVEQADDITITDLVVSPDGSLLATAAEHAGHLKLWGLAGGRLLSARTLGKGSLRLAFRPDGRVLAVVQEDKVLLFDLPPPAADLIGLGAFPLDDADRTPDGRRLLTLGTHPATDLQVLTLFDKGNRLRQTAVARQSGNAHRRAALAPNGRQVFAHVDREYAGWAMATKAAAPAPIGPATDTRAIRVAPDGTPWAAGGVMVQAWPNGTHWEKAISGPAGSLHVDAAGGLVGRNDGTLLRFAPDGKRLSADRIASVAITGLVRDGDRIIAGTAAGDVLMLKSDGTRTTLAAHTDAVWAVAAGPNGWFATGSGDRTVRVWDGTGRPAVTLPQTRPVRRLFWSADGNELWVLAAGERAVRRWHLDRLNAAFVEMGVEPIKP